METEPTTLMTILDILLQVVAYFIVMGGFLFFLGLINKFLHSNCPSKLLLDD